MAATISQAKIRKVRVWFMRKAWEAAGLDVVERGVAERDGAKQRRAGRGDRARRVIVWLIGLRWEARAA
jgi:hypothetical protein